MIIMMIFNTSTSNFSRIFISLFWGLFNDETDWPQSKVVSNLGMFRCKVKGTRVRSLRKKGPLQGDNGVLPNFSNAFAHGAALLSMKSNLTFDFA